MLSRNIQWSKVNALINARARGLPPRFLLVPVDELNVRKKGNAEDARESIEPIRWNERTVYIYIQEKEAESTESSSVL